MLLMLSFTSSLFSEESFTVKVPLLGFGNTATPTFRLILANTECICQPILPVLLKPGPLPQSLVPKTSMLACPVYDSFQVNVQGVHVNSHILARLLPDLPTMVN